MKTICHNFYRTIIFNASALAVRISVHGAKLKNITYIGKELVRKMFWTGEVVRPVLKDCGPCLF